MKITGKGFAPGHAYGKVLDLSSGLLPNEPSSICLLKEPNLERIIQLSELKPSGILIIGTQRFSHCLIYLFSLGVPSIFISEGQSAYVKSSKVFMDASTGVIEINPDQKRVSFLESNISNHRNEIIEQAQEKVVTIDGVSISLLASISGVDGARDSKIYGADEIGLLRSEFMFLHNILPPTTSENLESLSNVLVASSPLPVTIRLFDIGGEKIFSWVPNIDDMNITLGARGSRLYNHPSFEAILAAQLEAISELSTNYDISILIPYLSSVNDLKLLRKKILKKLPPHVRLGAMLENPAMCLSISEIVNFADFIAIGTNDLMQTYFGADRASNFVSRYLDPYSPSLLRFFYLINQEIQNSKKDIRVRICGQLALYPFWMQLFIGMGFNEFSVEPHVIPIMKQTIRKLRLSELQIIAKNALRISSNEKLMHFLQSKY